MQFDCAQNLGQPTKLLFFCLNFSQENECIEIYFYLFYFDKLQPATHERQQIENWLHKAHDMVNLLLNTTYIPKNAQQSLTQ